MAKHRREDDYVELGRDSPYRYNPIADDPDAYASLLNNLFGRGKEPFWQQAYTNLVKFTILLYKTLDGYVRLINVYECAINSDLLEERIEECRRRFERVDSVLVDPEVYVQHPQLHRFPFEIDKRAS